MDARLAPIKRNLKAQVSTTPLSIPANVEFQHNSIYEINYMHQYQDHYTDFIVIYFILKFYTAIATNFTQFVKKLKKGEKFNVTLFLYLKFKNISLLLLG